MKSVNRLRIAPENYAYRVAQRLCDCLEVMVNIALSYRFLDIKLTWNLGRKTDRGSKICCFDSRDTLRAQNVGERLFEIETIDVLAIHPS
jgi:hypothetical protein